MQSGRPKASVVVLALGTKLASGALGFGILAAESRIEAHECRASRSVRGQRDPGCVPGVRELHRDGREREREREREGKKLLGRWTRTRGSCL
jgi:hypothetical protein